MTTSNNSSWILYLLPWLGHDQSVCFCQGRRCPIPQRDSRNEMPLMFPDPPSKEPVGREEIPQHFDWRPEMGGQGPPPPPLRKPPKAKRNIQYVQSQGKRLPQKKPYPQEDNQEDLQAVSVPVKKNYLFPVNRFLLTLNQKDPSLESSGIGLKVVGGKELPDSTGRLATYVAKVFPERMIGAIPEIFEGDVIVEWNGVNLENKTFEEVASIMKCNRTEEIELVVRSDYNILTGKPRPVTERMKGKEHPDVDNQTYFNPDSRFDERRRSSQYSLYEGESQQGVDEFSGLDAMDQEMNSKGGNRLVKSPSLSSTEATSASGFLVEEKFAHHLMIPSEMDMRKRSTTSLPPSFTDEAAFRDRYARKGSENVSVKSMRLSPPGKTSRAPTRGRKKGTFGQIQLQICHDAKASVLYVSVLKARLPKDKNEDGTDHLPVDPYVSVFLLPERVMENQRRTRHVPMTSNPQYNQTMVYPNVTTFDLKEKYLEVSVYNYNPTGDDPLLGTIILYLSDEGILDERAHTYSLRLEDDLERRRTSQGQPRQIRKASRPFIFSDEPQGYFDDKRDPEES